MNVESGRNQAEAVEKKPSKQKIVFSILSQPENKKFGSMRVIHGSGVLFHLEELHSVFRGIEALFDTDGVLVAEFIYLPGMIEKCAYDQIYHEHLLYYSLSSLKGYYHNLILNF